MQERGIISGKVLYKDGSPAQSVTVYIPKTNLFAYTDEKGNMYGAYFVHSDKKFDGTNYIKTKPNVITAVNVLYFSNNK